GDSKKEIMVLGWADLASGSGIGFIDVPSPNTYTDGSVFKLVDFGDVNQFNVSGNPSTVAIAAGVNIPYILLEPVSGRRTLIALDGISDVSFVGSSNIQRVWSSSTFSWGGLSWGDQDHGRSSDGFEIYIPNGQKVASLEYKGSGSPTDSVNFTLSDSLFSLGQVFKSSSGAITDIVTWNGMDLNGNGRREIVANYKPGTDTLKSGEALARGTYAFFVLEWGDSSTVVSVAGYEGPVTQYELDQNYPNPFNPTTTIRFLLPTSGTASLRIFDINGREVRTLFANKEFDAGRSTVQWDGRNNAGKPVASGTYFYRLEVGSYSNTRKMILLK
ncbi:MAG: T9SS type A sorting domain-containing protein, partial [Ignavibacteriales bacterium]|nr:T9SS type A sorting domain-containing protein [Ignavibacteriales bacterium]